jgi:hypothetical protein
LQDAKITAMIFKCSILYPSSLALLLLVVGCTHYRSEKTVETKTIVRQEPAPAQPAAPVEMIDSVILGVRDAPDAGAEAAALNRLHTWLTDHQMMFQVTAVDAGGRAVPEAATVTYPVNVKVSIFQQQQPYRDFGFTPHDNRNLAILGVQ